MESLVALSGLWRRKAGRRIAALGLALMFAGAFLYVGGNIANSFVASAKYELSRPAPASLSLWITQPDYTGEPPLILSTPESGPQRLADVISIPFGSIVSAQVKGEDEPAPELVFAGKASSFALDKQGDRVATRKVTTGDRISVRRGWSDIATWHINVIPNHPPSVAWNEAPSLVNGKALRLPYHASDLLGIADIALRVTPHNPLPGANNTPVDLPLAVPPGKDVSRVDVEDIDARPWAGQVVTVQIVATNLAGKNNVSEPHDLKLPDRSFAHPLARMLIEERKKLLARPDDNRLRNEIANIMAALAQDAATRQGDPLLLMAMRTGAVRLVLSNDHAAAVAANDLLWHAAAHIENGGKARSQRALRDTHRDMAKQ